MLLLKTLNNIKGAVYTDSSGAPNSLMAANNASTAVIAGWNNISIPAITVTSGQNYWLTFNSSAALVGTKTASGSVRRYKSATYTTLSPIQPVPASPAIPLSMILLLVGRTA
jgi:hypothetical protein